jgi:hypothetical protein
LLGKTCFNLFAESYDDNLTLALLVVTTASFIFTQTPGKDKPDKHSQKTYSGLNIKQIQGTFH